MGSVAHIPNKGGSRHLVSPSLAPFSPQPQGDIGRHAVSLPSLRLLVCTCVSLCMHACPCVRVFDEVRQ